MLSVPLGQFTYTQIGLITKQTSSESNQVHWHVMNHFCADWWYKSAPPVKFRKERPSVFVSIPESAWNPSLSATIYYLTESITYRMCTTKQLLVFTSTYWDTTPLKALSNRGNGAPWKSVYSSTATYKVWTWPTSTRASKILTKQIYCATIYYLTESTTYRMSTTKQLLVFTSTYWDTTPLKALSNRGSGAPGKTIYWSTAIYKVWTWPI